jgi:hypothetical protein
MKRANAVPPPGAEGLTNPTARLATGKREGIPVLGALVRGSLSPKYAHLVELKGPRNPVGGNA